MSGRSSNENKQGAGPPSYGYGGGNTTGDQVNNQVIIVNK
jgi:hypothetical protein